MDTHEQEQADREMLARHHTDTGYAPSRWEFDQEVTRVFDDMLDRSIPQYETMREAVNLIALAYLEKSTTVLDLGCARGEAIERLLPYADPSVRFFGVESSQPMLQAARERFAPDIDAGDERVQIIGHDLRHGIPVSGRPTSVVLSVLTLMFVPVNYRQQIVEQVYTSLTPGGCLILVEKVLGSTAALDRRMTAIYHSKKQRSGYTAEQVERKRLALEGVLVPLTARWNEEMLRHAGFREIDCFWRWMNFVGWVSVR